MRTSAGRGLLVQRLLPFAVKFLWRQPRKFAQLRQHGRDFIERYRKIAALTDSEVELVEQVLHQLECLEPLYQERHRWGHVPMGYSVVYALVRVMKPDVMVETGVHEGWSAWFTLLAMEQNRRGVLHSIDLPNQDVELAPGGPRQTELLPEGKQPGWRVPGHLRSRWHLHLGDARQVLPQLLPALGPIDIFVHDSLHTYDHMMFEYETAWPHLRPGGLLLSDDINLHSAWSDFAAKIHCPDVIFTFTPPPRSFGAIRKPKERT